MRFILTEFNDARLALSQEVFDICRGTISQPNPNNLGWKSQKKTSLMKVGILGDDDETAIAGEIPNLCVIGVPQTDQPHVRGTGEDELKGL